MLPSFDYAAAIPTLETERLVLRAHRIDDFPHSLAMWTDPVVTRFIGGKPSTPQQTWSRLINYVGHWCLMGFGYWAIEEKASGTFIGELGFADFHRDIDRSMQDVPEFGWALAASAHGKHYATEATRAATSWGDRHLDSERTVCLINPGNVASIRVAERNGYRLFQETTFNDQPTLFFERRVSTE